MDCADTEAHKESVETLLGRCHMAIISTPVRYLTGPDPAFTNSMNNDPVTFQRRPVMLSLVLGFYTMACARGIGLLSSEFFRLRACYLGTKLSNPVPLLVSSAFRDIYSVNGEPQCYTGL